MTMDARRALRNYIDRNYGWMLLIAIGHFLLTLSSIGGFDRRLPIWGVFFFSVLFFYAGQDRAWARTLLTLPLSIQDTGRVLWWAAIGFPGIAVSALNTLAVLIFVAFGSKLLPAWEIGIWLLATWGALGLFIWTRAPAPSTAWTARSFMAALITVPLYLTMLGIPINNPWLPAIAGLSMLGAAAALYLYLRPERFALRLIRPARRGSNPGRAGVTSGAHRLGMSGWVVLARRVGASLLWTAAFFVAMLLLMPSVLQSSRSPHWITISLILIMIPVLLKPWFAAARVFRALPFSLRVLTNIFLSMSLVPTAIMTIAMYGSCNLLSLACADMPTSAAPMLFWSACLTPPLLLRFGGTGPAEVFIFTALWIGSILVVVIAMLQIHSPTMVPLLATGVLALGSYLWTRYELRIGRNAYRVHRAGAFSSGQPDVPT